MSGRRAGRSHGEPGRKRSQLSLCGARQLPSRLRRAQSVQSSTMMNERRERDAVSSGNCDAQLARGSLSTSSPSINDVDELNTASASTPSTRAPSSPSTRRCRRRRREHEPSQPTSSSSRAAGRRRLLLGREAAELDRDGLALLERKVARGLGGGGGAGRRGRGRGRDEGGRVLPLGPVCARRGAIVSTRARGRDDIVEGGTDPAKPR